MQTAFYLIKHLCHGSQESPQGMLDDILSSFCAAPLSLTVFAPLLVFNI